MEMFMREFISYSEKVLDAENIWLLEQEFGDLREESLCLELSSEMGKRLENRRKNRYRDILPFDDTRVTLPTLLNDPDSDYINANLVRGATGQHYSYIAAQGPLRHTLGDFWRMLFHYNVKLIVMLCNERENDKPKCERYWPTAADQPHMRVEVFDLTHWTDDEHFSLLFRDPANTDLNWEYRGESGNDASDHEPANGVITSPREVSIASHYELELLNELETREAYVVRQIRATKVVTMLTWTEAEEPDSSPKKGNATDNNVNTKSDTVSSEVREPVANVSDAPQLTAVTDNPSQPEAGATQVQSSNAASEVESASASASATARQSETEENDTFYENVTQRKVRRTSRREIVKESRLFVQYHYRHWADYAAADELDSILAMHNNMRQFQPSVVQPICVHCSAGCGRTGTILFIDYVQTLVNRGLLSRFLLRKRKAHHQPGEAEAETEPRSQLDEDEDDLSLNLKVNDDDDDDDRRRPQVPRLRLDDAMQSRTLDDEGMDTKPNGGAEVNSDTDLEYDYERSAREFVRSIVLEFRKQRPASVQSFEQFAMCYRATCEIFRKQLELLDAHQYANLEDLRTARRSASPQGLSSGQTLVEDTRSSNVDNAQSSISTPVHTQTVISSLSPKVDGSVFLSDPSDSGKNEQLALTVNSTTEKNDVVDLSTCARSSDLLECSERPARSRTPDAAWTGLPHSSEPGTALLGNDRRQSKDDSHLQDVKLQTVVTTKGNASSDVSERPPLGATLTSE